MQVANKSLFERTLSVLPVVLSTLALTISFFSFNLTAVRNIRPVLTLAYRNDSGWYLRNIGNGPALNVIVAERPNEGEWVNPVRVPPLANGGEILLHWLGHTNIKWIGATYTDIDDRPYSSLTSEDLTSIRNDNAFPRWREQDIRKHWEILEVNPR
jgi:hypothetical protein